MSPSSNKARKYSAGIGAFDSQTVNKLVKNHDKEYLATALLEVDQTYKETLKRAILGGRIDLLATRILGYGCYEHHRQLLAYQANHPQSLQLVFRGAGKTTISTVVKGIWYVCVDPELRVLIVSKTDYMAKSILKEIKHQLTNPNLVDLFGEFAPRSLSDPNIVWNEREVNIQQRRRITKEATFTALGAESAIVGKHYDVQLIDDLVDEDNSRTLQQRDRIKKFYYKVLDPCLEPPNPDNPLVGQRHVIGTRYHPDDMYGHLKDHEFKDHTQVIPALTLVSPDGEEPVYKTPWPEKFSVAHFLQKRESSGSAIFDSQYQCDIDSMKGEVFKRDWFEHEDIWYDILPAGTRIWSAADLAISVKMRADKFAHVTIGVHEGLYYLIDYVWGRFSFSQQTTIIGERFLSQDPIRVAVESVAYQAAQLQSLTEKYPDMRGRIHPVYTNVDKMTRAWKLTALFEAKLVRVKHSVHQPFIDHMIAFRDGGEDDLFDAFDMAVTLSQRGVRKRREHEPGVF